MRIVEIKAAANGSHRNAMRDSFDTIPDGWAIVADDTVIPQTFPFVIVTLTDDGKAALAPDQDAYDAAMSAKSDEDGGADVPSDASFEARLTALEAEAEQAKADREALNILLGGAE